MHPESPLSSCLETLALVLLLFYFALVIGLVVYATVNP